MGKQTEERVQLARAGIIAEDATVKEVRPACCGFKLAAPTTQHERSPRGHLPSPLAGEVDGGEDFLGRSVGVVHLCRQLT